MSCIGINKRISHATNQNGCSGSSGSGDNADRGFAPMSLQKVVSLFGLLSLAVAIAGSVFVFEIIFGPEKRRKSRIIGGEMLRKSSDYTSAREIGQKIATASRWRRSSSWTR